MMMRNSKVVDSFVLVLAILLFVPLLVLPMEVVAKTKIVAIEGISYNVNSSLKDNLRPLIGKRVTVTLNSGKTFIGLVKEVGNHLIHLEKLDGKEYFDALLIIEDISAIDTRFRKKER